MYRTGEAKEKQVAQPEQEAPKENAPAQAAQQPAQAVPHPVSEAIQATPGGAAAPVKKEGIAHLQYLSLDTVSFLVGLLHVWRSFLSL